jgi:hemolysin activation/secretion protein
MGAVCEATRRMLLCWLFVAPMVLSVVVNWVQAAEQEPTFDIKAFSIEGNTLFPEKDVQEIVRAHLGTGKTAVDVEKARDALEKLYHDKGYPAVLVNLPEQTVEDGIIRLQVIESKIGNVRVTGNRFYTKEKIRSALPSLVSGKVLYVPDVQKDLERINRGQDLKASPSLAPGKELGLTDVEVKVEDQLPLHGSLELNNRSLHDTTALRLNAMLRYDNLWQRDHSASLQYQTSPQDTGQVKLYAFSYSLPAPWMSDHQIAVYGVRSDSNTLASGQGLSVAGKGSIYGTRYIVPLTPYEMYAHNVTLGLDYKDFKESVGFNVGGATTETPITYAPLSVAYNASHPDSWGMTRFSSGLNVVFRGLVTDQREFEVKRYEAKGNYMYLTAGVERNQKLPFNMSLFLKLDGQIADQPLISNEQYIAGGMTSVRGYREAEALGDDALHGTAEVSAPDMAGLVGLARRAQLTPFIFYDFAWLRTKSPLPSQSQAARLQGAGAGIRGSLYKYLYCELDLAFPLADTDRTDKYHAQWHFKVGVQF